MSKKKKTNCGDCRYQMSGFDGGFFGLPVTCECRIFGETENRENCRKFEKKITREYLFDKIYQLEKENKQLKASLERKETLLKIRTENNEKIMKSIHQLIIYLENSVYKSDVSAIAVKKDIISLIKKWEVQ